MPKNIINYKLDRALTSYTKLSSFDQIIREINPSEIPSKYIHNVLIQYRDGNIIELKHETLPSVVPFGLNMTWDKSFSSMQDVRIFISVDILEQDINRMVNNYLGPYC